MDGISGDIGKSQKSLKSVTETFNSSTNIKNKTKPKLACNKLI